MKYTLTKNQSQEDGYYLTFKQDGSDVEKILTPLDYNGFHFLYNDIKKYINRRNNNNVTNIVVKNDSDFPPVGVIVDLYRDNDDDPDTACFWFDDYLSNED